jgi:hypothetical protein
MIIVRDQRWPQKDTNKRKFIVRHEMNKLILHSLVSHIEWPKIYRLSFIKRLSKYTRRYSVAYCRNNCAIRVIGHSIFTFSKMSRFCTKYYANWGYTTGLRRSSF